MIECLKKIYKLSKMLEMMYQTVEQRLFQEIKHINLFYIRVLKTKNITSTSICN